MAIDSTLPRAFRAATVLVALFSPPVPAQTTTVQQPDIQNIERPSKEYEEQFQKLDRISSDIEQLIRFINEEQGRLFRARKAIEALQARHSQLQPIVAADQSLVESLFGEQDRRNDARAWYERGVSFVIGVFSSLLAAFLFPPLTRLIARKAERAAFQHPK